MFRLLQLGQRRANIDAGERPIGPFEPLPPASANPPLTRIHGVSAHMVNKALTIRAKLLPLMNKTRPAFAADTDEQAIVCARAKKLSVRCEIWDRNRLVAELPAHPT
jgi:hypothetical protein